MSEQNVKALTFAHHAKVDSQQRFTRKRHQAVAFSIAHVVAGTLKTNIDNDKQFISARHDETFNEFERNWIDAVDHIV